MSSKLSSLLVQDGRVSARRMADAFERRVIFGGSLDTILLEMALVEPDVLADCLGRAHGIPFTDEIPAKEAIAAEADRGLTAQIAERFVALPLGRRGGKLRVLVKDPVQPQRLADLASLLGTDVDPAITFEYRYHQAFEYAFGVALPARYAALARKVRERRGAPGASLDAGAAPARPPVPSLFAGRKARTATVARSTTPAVDAAPPISTPRADLEPTMAVVPTTRSPASMFEAERGAEAMGGAPAVAEARAAGTSGARAPRPALFAPGSARAARRPPAAAERLAAAFSGEASREREPSPAIEPGTAPATAATEGVKPRTTLSFPAVAPLQPAVESPRGSLPRSASRPRAPTGAPAGAQSGSTAAQVARGASPHAADGYPDLGARSGPPTGKLSLAEGVSRLQAATSRDAVFEVLCRLARARFACATIFTVQRGVASVRMALGSDFVDTSSLAGATVELAEPSPLRTTVKTQAPFIGRIEAADRQDAFARALADLGRPLPLPVALLPLVLRGRAVAVLVADNGGQPVDAGEIADLAQAVAEAANAFRRLIQAQKKGGGPNAR